MIDAASLPTGVGREALIFMLGKLEAKVEALEVRVTSLEGGTETRSVSSDEPEATKVLMGLTIKQHAVLQMILNARSNQEIAERLDVKESTAKVHVRLIARKCGLTKRQQIAGYFRGAFEGMADEQYVKFSRGLPKNWDSEWGNGTEEFDELVR